MALYYHRTKLLTAKALRCDPVAHDLGYWKIMTMLHDKPIEFLIAQGRAGQPYMLAVNGPFEYIGAADTLEEIAEMYNNYVARAYVPQEILERADVYILIN